MALRYTRISMQGVCWDLFLYVYIYMEGITRGS